MKTPSFWQASALAALGAAMAHAAAHVDTAAALKEKYGEIRERLDKSAFGRPLLLDSREKEAEMQGEVYALVPHPFATVRDALAKTTSWCEILTLPFNMQKCEAEGDALRLFIGRKPESPLAEAKRLDFRYALAQDGQDLFEARLAAATGPAGTRNYRINFSATPLGPDRTFVHLSYGYAHSAWSRMAMQAYLSTSGADKVGFTNDGKDDEGRARLVGGMRGVLERNTMRYFLAIEAYLDSLAVPEPQRRHAQLEKWFKATERFPRQLHEMSRERYLAIKEGRSLPEG